MGPRCPSYEVITTIGYLYRNIKKYTKRQEIRTGFLMRNSILGNTFLWFRCFCDFFLYLCWFEEFRWWKWNSNGIWYIVLLCVFWIGIYFHHQIVLVLLFVEILGRVSSFVLFMVTITWNVGDDPNLPVSVQ
jgi:hypothetical protein